MVKTRYNRREIRSEIRKSPKTGNMIQNIEMVLEKYSVPLRLVVFLWDVTHIKGSGGSSES